MFGNRKFKADDLFIILLPSTIIILLTLKILVLFHAHSLVKSIPVFSAGLLWWPFKWMLFWIIIGGILYLVFPKRYSNRSVENIEPGWFTLPGKKITLFENKSDRQHNNAIDSFVLNISLILVLFTGSFMYILILTNKYDPNLVLSEIERNMYQSGAMEKALSITNVDFNSFLDSAYKNNLNLDSLQNLLMENDSIFSNLEYAYSILKRGFNLCSIEHRHCSFDTDTLLSMSVTYGDTITAARIISVIDNCFNCDWIVKSCIQKGYTSVLNNLFQKNSNGFDVVKYDFREDDYHYDSSYLSYCAIYNRPDVAGLLIGFDTAYQYRYEYPLRYAEENNNKAVYNILKEADSLKTVFWNNR